MKWKYNSGADVYTRHNHEIVVSHTPDFDEKFTLNNGEYVVIIPLGQRWYGLHKVNQYLRNKEDETWG